MESSAYKRPISGGQVILRWVLEERVVALMYNQIHLHTCWLSIIDHTDCVFVCVCVCVCVFMCLFPSTVEASPDWNKTINVMPEIKPAMLCWGNYYVSSTFVATSETITAGTFKLATVQECQLNWAEPREVKDKS